MSTAPRSRGWTGAAGGNGRAAEGGGGAAMGAHALRGPAERRGRKRRRGRQRRPQRCVEKGVGLLEWCGRFVDGGGLCFKPQRFLRRLRSRRQRRVRPSGSYAGCGVAGSGGPGRCPAAYARPSRKCGDLSKGGRLGTSSRTRSGGTRAGHFAFFGRWDPESLAAFAKVAAKQGKRGQWEEAGSADRAGALGNAGEAAGDHDAERGESRVWSISPAELLVAALNVRALRNCEGELPGGGPTNGEFYSRCDNESAVRMVNAGRMRSTSMTEAMWVMREQKIGGPGGRRMRMRLEHIRTEVSKVAGLLSRGDVEEAKLVRSWRGGRCEVRALGEGLVREMERRVRDAALEEYKGRE